MHHITLKVEGLSNACGTIAMLHAILNNRDMLGVLENDCTLGKFYQETKDLSAEERGKALDNSADIGSVHNGLVAEGQSQQVEGKHTRFSTVYMIRHIFRRQGAPSLCLSHCCGRPPCRA